MLIVEIFHNSSRIRKQKKKKEQKTQPVQVVKQLITQLTITSANIWHGAWSTKICSSLCTIGCGRRLVMRCDAIGCDRFAIMQATNQFWKHQTCNCIDASYVLCLFVLLFLYLTQLFVVRCVYCCCFVFFCGFGCDLYFILYLWILGFLHIFCCCCGLCVCF